MDTKTLVEASIDDGQKVLDQLSQSGFEVAAAFWLKFTDIERWRFYIASPLVDAEGLAKAYEKLHFIIRAMPQLSWLDPMKIRLSGIASPIAKDVLAIYARVPGLRTSPIRWGDGWLGGRSVDDAYLYPLPAGVH